MHLMKCAAHKSLYPGDYALLILKVPLDTNFAMMDVFETSTCPVSVAIFKLVQSEDVVRITGRSEPAHILCSYPL